MSTGQGGFQVPTRGYSSEQLGKFFEDLEARRTQHHSLRMDLSRLAEQLTNSRAATFVNEGVNRRLGLVERSAVNIFALYPPDRPSFLSNEECTDVSIQFQAFAINVYALFDNIAWVCVLERGINLNPMEIGPLKPKAQACMPPALAKYLQQSAVAKWFREYGKSYRDSTAHRIPPYLPTRVFTGDEGERWQRLNRESIEVLLDYQPGDRADERLARCRELEEEKDSIGSNSLLVALSLVEREVPPVFLHPQVLCDWALSQELVENFCRSMREHYGWAQPTLPGFALAPLFPDR